MLLLFLKSILKFWVSIVVVWQQRWVGAQSISQPLQNLIGCSLCLIFPISSRKARLTSKILYEWLYWCLPPFRDYFLSLVPFLSLCLSYFHIILQCNTLDILIHPCILIIFCYICFPSLSPSCWRQVRIDLHHTLCASMNKNIKFLMSQAWPLVISWICMHNFIGNTTEVLAYLKLTITFIIFSWLSPALLLSPDKTSQTMH